MRDYQPLDDGHEPTDFDEYFDIPAQTDGDFAARVYVRIERDPKRAADMQQRQNTATMDVLQWIRDNRAQFARPGARPLGAPAGMIRPDDHGARRVPADRRRPCRGKVHEDVIRLGTISTVSSNIEG